MKKISAVAARQNASQRLLNLPIPTFPQDLPVVARREEILRAIAAHQVVIVCGETGSGKTTQLPKICLELKRGLGFVGGMIAHTQPRRIAARTVAARIATELNSPLGQAVGYKVRFSDKLSAQTYIKLMTDGILLAETQGDPKLLAYDIIIIDEAHERSLNIDFLLGYLLQLLPQRPDLKVIVTSATIDAARFSKHFKDAPVIEVSGRMFPVEMRYRALGEKLNPPLPPRKLSHFYKGGGDMLDASRSLATPPFEKGGQGGFEAGTSQNLNPPQSPFYKGGGDGTKPVDDDEGDLTQGILDAVDELSRLGAGDILIFLPGEREIRETAEALRKHHPAGAEILPLFARLSFAEQERVFKPGDGSSVGKNGRRIVLATNVAETSLTVPGIRYVIDTGIARLNRYSYRNKVEQLQIEKISQASANQRSGRCGRVMNGTCIRLYAEQDYQSRAPYTDPEILRSSLAAVILRMKSLHLGEVENFPFIDPPQPRMIADGYQLLTELGAVNEARALTDIGWQLARFPIDPKIARMILAAKAENCLREVLIIASALSLQDVRDRPFERQDAADKAHLKFNDERSDFLAYLNIWEFFEGLLQHKKSNRKLTETCQEHFLNHRRMREWREIHGQLHALVAEMGLRENQIPAGYDEIHRALLAGLLGNIGFKLDEGNEYLGARAIKFSVFPGSALKKTKAKWLVAAELTDTTKLYARCVAKIDPQWLEKIAGDLCKHHYFDPHWEKQSGEVAAYERVLLYGLTIVAKRRVHYGRVNPREAREIFIRRALVAGDVGEQIAKAGFFSHNQQCRAEVEALEHKARRQDVLVGDADIFDFYDARIPQDIVGSVTFEKWRKLAEAENPRLLYLSKTDLMRHGATGITEAQFPETVEVGENALDLSYRFEPGHALDGVTLTVPLPLLNTLNAAQFDALVPGLIREKVTWYFKALPKQLRRYVVPVPDSVTKFLLERDAGVGAGSKPAQNAEPDKRAGLEPAPTAPTAQLATQLARFVQRRAGIPVAPEIWEDQIPPPHLLMNYRVVDDADQELAMSRDLAQLKTQLGQAAAMTFTPDRGAATGSSDAAAIERDHVTRWDFGNLPQQLSFERGSKKLVGYPALVDETDHVAIRLFDTLSTAKSHHRAGVRRLLRLELSLQMKQLDKTLSASNQIALQLRTLFSPDALKEDMLDAIADRAFIGEDALPHDEAAFNTLKTRARTRLPAVSEAVSRNLQLIAAQYQALMLALEAKSAQTASHAKLKADLLRQLSGLLYGGFLSHTPWARLQHLPRYLQGMLLRWQKYAANAERDQRHAPTVNGLWNQYEARADKHRKAGIADENLVEFRWQLEELRISLFAQELKTPYPVSVKRLQKLWGAVKQ